jgi:nitroimidazol reductase NimA-like FMN-containing flavoprotein (pyridoxamine 5'-phosphate oxidase superfamily)
MTETSSETSEEYEIIVDELDEEACWRLAAQAAFGRVAFIQDFELWILPVNTAVVDGCVVFRTADASMLHAAGDSSMVAFEADHTDRVNETGWSVLVRGRLRDVTDNPDTGTWHELTVRPWAPGPRNRKMAIEPSAISGRMIHRRRVLARPDRRPADRHS